MDEIQTQLEQPMPVHWKPQGKPILDRNTNTHSCIAVPYLTANQCCHRLDEVFGPLGWTPHCEVIREEARKDEKSTLHVCVVSCMILVTHPTLAEAVGKQDIGFARAATYEEALKAAYSDGLKRAAKLWEVGRFIDDIERVNKKCRTREYKGEHYFSGWIQDPPTSPRAQSQPKAATEPKPTDGTSNNLKKRLDQAVEVYRKDFSLPLNKLVDWVGPRSDWNEETLARFEKHQADLMEKRREVEQRRAAEAAAKNTGNGSAETPSLF